MKTRIPTDAFDFYVSLGPQRSYEATAKEYGVSKCAVSKCAQRENWHERLAKIETDAREMSDRKLTETLAEMHDRHAKTLKAIHVRAVEALRAFPIDNCMDAVKAVDMVIRAERLAAGEATKRSEQSIVEVMKHEMRTMLTLEPDEDEPRSIEATMLDGEADDEPGEE